MATEHRAQGVALRPREAAESVEKRRTKLMQASETKVGLGLDSSHPHELASGCVVGEVLSSASCRSPDRRARRASDSGRPSHSHDPLEHVALAAPPPQPAVGQRPGAGSHMRRRPSNAPIEAVPPFEGRSRHAPSRLGSGPWSAPSVACRRNTDQIARRAVSSARHPARTRQIHSRRSPGTLVGPLAVHVPPGLCPADHGPGPGPWGEEAPAGGGVSPRAARVSRSGAMQPAGLSRSRCRRRLRTWPDLTTSRQPGSAGWRTSRALELIGRTDEMAVLSSLLERAPDQGGAMVLRGEAGAGQDGTAPARDRVGGWLHRGARGRHRV